MFVFKRYCKTVAVAVSMSCLAGSSCTSESPILGAGGFATRCREAADAAAAEKRRAVRGENEDWFFLARELRHLGMREYWKADWKTVAANGQDPVLFIEHFRDLLKEKGVDLLLVPVSPKAAHDPENLFAEARRSDVTLESAFFGEMDARGIRIANLENFFLGLKKDGPRKIFCEQDTHWTPFGCQRAAGEIVDAIEGSEWLPGIEKTEVVLGPETALEIHGDLVDDDAFPRETLPVRYAGVEGPAGAIERLPSDSDSPVLLLGDSHVLVFHEGAGIGMHCDRAGLADHLQERLGFAIDVVGVRGSGMVAARRALLEHASGAPGYWEKKKLVIWCFASREFTQSTDRFLEIPIERE